MKARAKKGVASLYVVIFATILFGVITVSFARIILSEVAQSSNDDLSRSAYDSALAGVEDAKIAVNRYFRCVAQYGATDSRCVSLNVFSSDTNCEDGFPLAKVLHGVDSGEVKIQETTDSTSDTVYDQAYTCVLISDITEDYRGTLTADTRSKVVPVGTVGLGTSGSSTLGQVSKVRFSWFSELNQGSNTTFRSATKLPNYSNRTVPPTMQLTFIKTSSSINLSDFHSENNTSNIIDSTMVFLPNEGTTSAITSVSATDISNAGNAYSSSGGTSSINNPISVNCVRGREFACVVDLEVGTLINANSNAFLVISLPYGDSYSDFSITLLDASGNPINFKGAQVSVDSTGRTNDLIRRIEVRLDPADLYFPYPQYALELTGSDDDSLKKNFWVTANCWTESGACLNNGSL